MSKIKSIKIKYDFPSSELVDLNQIIDGYNKKQVWALNHIQKWGHLYGLEYEPEKPKLLKRADGSLISEPETGMEVVIITNISNKIVVSHRYNQVQGLNHIELFLQGRVFLPEDRHLAEKKAKMLEKQLEIKNEIERMNAENSDPIVFDKEFAFRVNEHTDIVEVYRWTNTIPESWKMNEKTAGIILKRYSQNELKTFLDIIL